MEPGEPGSGIVYENDIVGGVIPKEFLPSVEKGVHEAAEAGVLAGYPVVDIKVRLHDGSYHEVDSSDMAFKMAASMAFKEGIHKGDPVLQEPIMKVEVIAPDEFLGEIMGQLNARRGNIIGTEVRPGNTQMVIRNDAIWLKCSVTPPIYGLPLRDEAFLRWNSTTILRSLRMWQKQYWHKSTSLLHDY